MLPAWLEEEGSSLVDSTNDSSLDGADVAAVMLRWVKMRIWNWCRIKELAAAH